MNRTQLQEMLPAYLDGQLGTDEMQAIERELALSPELRRDAERCAAMRRCIQRQIESGNVPAEARQRCVMKLAGAMIAARRMRYVRFGVTLAASAAAWLVISSGTWRPLNAGMPRGGAAVQATLVSAQNFADIYRRCSLRNHSQFSLESSCPVAATKLLAGEVKFPVVLPDLREQQFELAGICRCFRVPDVSAIHAHYVRKAAKPGEADQHLSVFTVSRCVKMQCCQGGCHGKRHYQSSENEGINVVAWDERNETVAFAGQLDRDALVTLADNAKMIAWSSSDLSPVEVAAVGEPH